MLHKRPGSGRLNFGELVGADGRADARERAAEQGVVDCQACQARRCSRRGAGLFRRAAFLIFSCFHPDRLKQNFNDLEDIETKITKAIVEILYRNVGRIQFNFGFP